MPRTSSDDASAAEDIPFKAPVKKKETMPKSKGKGKGKAKAEPVEDPQDSGSGDEEMEEDEYAVEHIVSHRFEPDGTLKLEVKWIGWPDSSNTWEPEDNLDGAQEELNKYYEEIGGKPIFGIVKTRKGAPAAKHTTKKEATPSSSKSKKRAAEDSPPTEKSERRTSRGQKRIKADDADAGETSYVNGKGKMVKLPVGSWEDRINSISTITKQADGKLIATVVWDDGSHQHHNTQVLYVRCPQKMLHFYESHLQFKDTPKYEPYEEQAAATQEDVAIQDASMAGIDALLDNVGEGVESVENGVKNVASSISKSVASTFSNVKDVVTKSVTPTAKAVAAKVAADGDDEEDEEEGL